MTPDELRAAWPFGGLVGTRAEVMASVPVPFPRQEALASDEVVLQFLRARAPGARYVTSVCTGALVLGAAGLLQGYRATTHWLSQDILVLFGAEPAAGRVVIDRNRITGGGVTAGIDFGLTVAAEMFGLAVAQEVQLMLEYSPAPPFSSGSPQTAPAGVVQNVIEARVAAQARRRAIAERAAARLGLTLQDSRASEGAG